MRSPFGFIIAGVAGAIVASLLPVLISSSLAESRLLPFQGRLTDAAGNGIADGAKVVEFKMYDAPTGGNVKWAGEVHKLSVNGGLVNTMLGSKASLGGVDFSSTTFLQITVDANGDGAITAADPPLLPRQSVVPSIYANVSGEAWEMAELNAQDKPTGNSYGWRAVFDNGNPETGRMSGAKLADQTVTGQHLAPGSISSGHIVDGTIAAADLSPGLLDIPEGAVTSARIADGTIQAVDVGLKALTPNRIASDMAVLRNKRAANEYGGTAVAGTWNVRPLTEIEQSLPPASSSIRLVGTDGTFALKRGKYHVAASSPAYNVVTHQLAMVKLGNPEVFSAIGSSAGADDAMAILSSSFLSALVEVTEDEALFQFKHYTTGGNGTNGFGNFVSGPVTANVYNQATIIRIE